MSGTTPASLSGSSDICILITAAFKLSGTNKPLSGDQKKKYAEHLFKHPVELADDKTNSFAAHLKDLSARGYKTAHVFVGSDRAPEISRIAAHHNLNNNAGYIDKKGQKSFHFPGGIHVHQFGDERLNLDKPSSTEEHHLAKIHPTKMTPDQLKRSTSATRLETLANKGDWSAFKAYHTGVNSKHVKTLYDNIRSGSK